MLLDGTTCLHGSNKGQHDSLVTPLRVLPELEVLLPQSEGVDRTPRPPYSWQVVIPLGNDGT